MTDDPSPAIATQVSLFDTSAPVTNAPDAPFLLGRTQVTMRDARDILTAASGFMAAYDYTLNPYSGCGFSCSYCYAAFFVSDERRDEWGNWVEAKANAVELLRKRPIGALDGKTIYMASVTDPYQGAETKLGLTRGLLQVLADRHVPKLVVQTRGPGVVRDADLFRRIVEQGGRVRVNVTVTTDDDEVRRIFEPSCPSNDQRLDAVAALHDAGVDVAVTMTPLLLVRDPEAFAERLLGTGAGYFIAQPFHFATGRFVAATRDDAFTLMAEKLGCPASEVHVRYMERYRATFSALKARLPHLGEGKDGFAPPF